AVDLVCQRGRLIVALLSLPGPPFRLEDGVNKRVPPAPLEILVFAQPAFLAHAQLLQYARRSRVVGDAPRPDAMHAQLGKAKLDHGMRRLAGIAAPPEFGVQFIANIRFSRVGAFETNAAVAD